MKEELTPEQELEKLKKQRHEAYRRWYVSDKGKAYRQKQKEKKALMEPTFSTEGPSYKVD